MTVPDFTKKTADVVVVGGGVVGASVAYHLAERGCTSVVVVEREARQGLGSTGPATGGVRAQFASPINILMSLYSIDFISHFEEATGHAAGYEPAGYLFVATSARHLAYLKSCRELQIKHGLANVELVSAQDIAEMLPQMRADDVVGGSFCRTDGFVSPLGIMRGFTERACERGVELWLDTEVTGIETDADGVACVETTRGRVSTRAVVNAAGAWAAEIGRLVGVEIPVTPLRRQIVSTKSVNALSGTLPMVIDMTDGFHFRPRAATDAPGFLLAWPDPTESPGFKTNFDPGFTDKIRRRAQERVPCLAEAEVDAGGCRAGLYEMTPDHHAIIGESPALRGLFLANGFSGHGVMHSPATGRLVSELILDGAARLLDIAPLAATRFAAGRLLDEPALL